jgi:hypothetical protein
MLRPADLFVTVQYCRQLRIVMPVGLVCDERVRLEYGPQALGRP